MFFPGATTDPSLHSQLETISSRFVSSKPKPVCEAVPQGNRYTRLMKKTSADPVLAMLWPTFEFGREYLGKRVRMDLSDTLAVNYRKRALVNTRHATVQKIPLSILPWVGMFVWHHSQGDRVQGEQGKILRTLLNNFLMLLAHSCLPMEDRHSRGRNHRDKKSGKRGEDGQLGPQITANFLEEYGVKDYMTGEEEERAFIADHQIHKTLKPLLEFEQYLVSKRKENEFIPASILQFVQLDSISNYMFCKKMTLLNNIILLGRGYVTSHLTSVENPKSNRSIPVPMLSEEDYISKNKIILRLEEYPHLKDLLPESLKAEF